jgi:hypothetical protein
VDWLAVLVALTGMMLVPFALNSGWWRVLLAGLLTLGLLLV